MVEVPSKLNVVVVYTWCAVDVLAMFLMCLFITIQTVRSGAKILTVFNILLYCMLIGWVISSITDALWYGYRIISLPIDDMLVFSGTALSLNGYVYLILARTKVLSDTVFPSYTKPLNYMSKLFLFVSLIPVLLSLINLFMHEHQELLLMLDKISSYVNIVAGLLIAGFDITCVIMFLKLYNLVQTNHVQSSAFKIIGKWGLHSSLCVLNATVFFAIHVVMDIPYTQFVSRSFGVLAGMFLLLMKISLNYDERTPSKYTKDVSKSIDTLQRTKDNSKSVDNLHKSKEVTKSNFMEEC